MLVGCSCCRKNSLAEQKTMLLGKAMCPSCVLERWNAFANRAPAAPAEAGFTWTAPSTGQPKEGGRLAPAVQAPDELDPAGVEHGIQPDGEFDQAAND